MRVAIDFGVSNIDAVADFGDGRRYWRLPGGLDVTPRTTDAVLVAGEVDRRLVTELAVTGGRSRHFPDEIDGLPVRRVSEIEAIGRGGLALAERDEALVVSAGTGVAITSARRLEPSGGPPLAVFVQHVGGTAVGGGTLRGLGRLLVGASDPWTIDALAQRGQARHVDLTIGDVIGGDLTHLSPNATAVNFGRVVDGEQSAAPEDIAAGLVTLIGQTIGLLTAKSAQAHDHRTAIIVGRLTELPSLRRVLSGFGAFFGGEIIIPAYGGRATVTGAFLA